MCAWDAGSQFVTVREEAALMYDRNMASPRSRRARRPRIRLLLAVAASVGVLVTGYFLLSPRATRATSAADVQGYLPAGGGGGWGEGGYPMMPGSPAGAANGGAAHGGGPNGGAANGGAANGGAANGGAANGGAANGGAANGALNGAS